MIWGIPAVMMRHCAPCDTAVAYEEERCWICGSDQLEARTFPYLFPGVLIGDIL